MMIRNARGRRYGPLLTLVTSFTAVAAALPASSEVWSFVGSRYQAMGGAGVAVVDDSLAQYWNPGALGFMRGWDAQLPVGGSYSIENRALESLSNLFQAADDAQAAVDAIPGGDLGGENLSLVLGLVDEFTQIGLDGQSLQGNLDVGLLGHVNRIGFGALSLTSVNIRPIFDTSGGLAIGTSAVDAVGMACMPECDSPTNTDLSLQIAMDNPDWDDGPPGGGPTYADQLVASAEMGGVDTTDPANAALLQQIAADTANGSTTLDANDAIGADIQGLSTQEIGISYGHPIPMPFFEPLDGKIAIGGVLKYMLGISYSKFTAYDGSEDIGDLIANAVSFDNVETSHNVGLDLGMLAQPCDWLRVGLVARNVNSPSFDRNVDVLGQQGDFVLEPQVRMGVAVMPFENWIVASDLDLTENSTLEVPSFDSRLFSVGTEYTLPVSWATLAFRLGGFLNVANLQNNDYALTAGLGMRFGNFLLEFGAGTSFKTEQFVTSSKETSTLPTRLNAGINLRWESRPEGTRRYTGHF